MVLAIVIGAGVAVAGVVALLAAKWPRIEAPRVSGEKVAEEVVQHPKLAARLRRNFDPKTATGVALTIATTAVAAATVGIGVLIAVIRSKQGLWSIDLRLARYGAQHASKSSTNTMRMISQVGGTTGAVVIALIATVVEFVRRPSRYIPMFTILVVGGQSALSNGIKYLVARARPDVSRLTGFAGSSFPSGHSTAAAATLAAVALLITRDRSRRAKTAAASIAAGAALVVGMTRVFLGVHWFTDVVAGLLLGWGWFTLCSIAFGGRLMKFGQPVAVAERVAEVTPLQATPAAANREYNEAVHSSTT
ncbi:MAG: phosphatase PAP2 family protein [Ilumatobacteraceae bacterium]